MNTYKNNLSRVLTAKTLRIPQAVSTSGAYAGDGSIIARQLDIAIMDVGFKCSRELLEYISKIHPTTAVEIASEVLDTVRELVGDHVQHNVYFKNFPAGVPDTLEFWHDCIADALRNPESAFKVGAALSLGYVNLLDLPLYGTYQHTYEQMLEAHEPFVKVISQKFTILHLGESLPAEALKVYTSLVESRVPASDSDRELLTRLAEVCLNDKQPKNIPVRENKAIINKVRLENNKPLLVDTVTDVLRLACMLSGGDVTLVKPTKFKTFSRPTRLKLLSALDTVSLSKHADINSYKEQWKRLGKQLHPHDYPLKNAQLAFDVAGGKKKVRTVASKVEQALADSNITKAVELLAKQPGVLMRSLDRIMRIAKPEDIKVLTETIQSIAPDVSAKVLLSVREHLQNRTNINYLAKFQDEIEKLSKKYKIADVNISVNVKLAIPNPPRIFANSKGKAYVTEDLRKPISEKAVTQVTQIIDAEINRRLPVHDNLYVDPEVFKLALPLSNKQTAEGFKVRPRGSVGDMLNPDMLRFFCYWKEKRQTTDFDLSVIFLDEKFKVTGQSSWTNLRGEGYKHGGDITSAPNGASEFIDIDLNTINAKYIVPQVNIYSGEDFDVVEESFFGYMLRTEEQKGKPFEPQTVKTKSDMRAKGKIALPIMFIRNEENGWYPLWTHLYLTGFANFNSTENNKLSTSKLVQGIVAKDYIMTQYIINMLANKAKAYDNMHRDIPTDTPITYIGLERPESLHADSTVITLDNLADLIPE